MRKGFIWESGLIEKGIYMRKGLNWEKCVKWEIFLNEKVLIEKVFQMIHSIKAREWKTLRSSVIIWESVLEREKACESALNWESVDWTNYYDARKGLITWEREKVRTPSMRKRKRVGKVIECNWGCLKESGTWELLWKNELYR